MAVYSDADAGALHVRRADSAFRIGPAPAVESYLDIEAVLAAAQQAGADAIHPGYGFLSENADFADACAGAGIAFVGPSSAAIRAMGSKVEAKRLVAAAGTPVVPGYQDDDQDDAVLEAAARELGFPLLIKASAGGGGKGMRLVEAPEEFAGALEGARREAAAAFADEKMLLERYLVNPKHLEVQILADARGNTIGVFRTGLFGPAPAPEGHRGSAGPDGGRTLAPALAGSRGQCSESHRLHGCGHSRIHRRGPGGTTPPSISWR